MRELTVNDIYPLTIIADRYNGVYSGGKYLAFNLHYYDIPEAISADDITCGEFWSEFKKPLWGIFSGPCGIVGTGNTPIEAATDLCTNMNIVKGASK